MCYMDFCGSLVGFSCVEEIQSQTPRRGVFFHSPSLSLSVCKNISFIKKNRIFKLKIKYQSSKISHKGKFSLKHPFHHLNSSQKKKTTITNLMNHKTLKWLNKVNVFFPHTDFYLIYLFSYLKLPIFSNFRRKRKIKMFLEK